MTNNENPNRGYLAPYQPLPPDVPPRDEYIVRFHDGHTIWKHFEAIGRTQPGCQAQNGMYICNFEQKDVEQVRRDPGVSLVEQVTREMKWKAIYENRSVITSPVSKNKEVPYYMITFSVPSSSWQQHMDNISSDAIKYTLEEHLAKIGLSMDDSRDMPGTGYTADLTNAQVRTVFTDPFVHHISKHRYGTFPGSISAE